MNKKKIAIILLVSCFITGVIGKQVYSIIEKIYETISISADIKTGKDSDIQYYFETFPSQQYSEENSLKQKVSASPTYEMVEGNLGIVKQIVSLRMDFGNEANRIFYVKNVKLKTLMSEADITGALLAGLNNDVVLQSEDGQSIKIMTTGDDPWISCIYTFQGSNDGMLQIVSIIDIVVLSLSVLLVYRHYVYLTSLKKALVAIFHDKKMIWKMAKNDFKQKYAGASLGITWAFLQPLMTILVFWFVFQIGFRNSPVSDAPFALWLTCGFIPWFFFQDAWISITYVLGEYNYLVKKMAFKMEYLPIIKILSSFFVHIAFLIFLIIFAALYGYKPTLSLLQLPYYTLCLVGITLALGFLTAAINVFFKDMGQLLGIILQFGMWLTPIMWDYHTLPTFLKVLFKINPMFYIVEGYRDCFIYHKNIWDHPDTTIIFWLLFLLLTRTGIRLFINLKPHFADIL